MEKAGGLSSLSRFVVEDLVAWISSEFEPKLRILPSLAFYVFLNIRIPDKPINSF